MVESTSPRNVLEYQLHYLQLGKPCGFSYLQNQDDNNNVTYLQRFFRGFNEVTLQTLPHMVQALKMKPTLISHVLDI